MASPKPLSANSGSKAANPLAKANAERRTAHMASMQAQVDAVLANPNIDTNLKTKLSYAHGETLKDREPGDLRLMEEVRKDLLRQVARITNVPWLAGRDG